MRPMCAVLPHVTSECRTHRRKIPATPSPGKLRIFPTDLEPDPRATDYWQPVTAVNYSLTTSHDPLSFPFRDGLVTALLLPLPPTSSLESSDYKLFPRNLLNPSGLQVSSFIAALTSQDCPQFEGLRERRGGP